MHRSGGGCLICDPRPELRIVRGLEQVREDVINGTGKHKVSMNDVDEFVKRLYLDVRGSIKHVAGYATVWLSRFRANLVEKYTGIPL